MDFNSLERTWIVSEIGVNHEGSIETAKTLVDAAADAGADAVKFQTYEPEGYISVEQSERLERVTRFALSRDDFRQLAAHAGERGITFFSTPLSLDDADFVAEIAPIIKIASGELTYLDLIRRVAEKGKPAIISTGLGLEPEIAAAVAAFLEVRPGAQEDGSLMLMHCVSAYPTPDAEANLRNVTWLRDRFALPVGYSDHTLGIKACELAVAVGAVALEKHMTDRRTGRDFRDHELSVEPQELRDLVDAVRQAEIFLGRYERVRGEAETLNMEGARRSVAAAVDIAEGTLITREMLTGLRPLQGIPVEQIERVAGRRSAQAVGKGALIRDADLSQ